MSRKSFVCTTCNRREAIATSTLGTPEEAARFVGWRLGTNGRSEPVAHCPECTGLNEDYWDDRTLGMAYAAGIDAGNPAGGAV